MGTARILRCHPFKGGIDYVPLTFRLTRNKKDKKEPDYKKVVKNTVALSDKEKEEIYCQSNNSATTYMGTK